MKTKVKNLENKEVGEIDLLDAVFGVTPRRDILDAHGKLSARQAPFRQSQGQGHQRSLGHDQEALGAKGHRPRASRQLAFAAIP